jgi:adhesin transport system outer membrane protein
MFSRTLKAAMSTVMMSSALCQPAQAQESLVEALQRVLKEHALIRVVDADVDVAKNQLAMERSAWLPRANVRGSYGYQDIERDVGASDDYNPSEITVGATQLLWDFGATNDAIERARRNLSKEELEHETQRQNLLLAGIEAHLKLVRAQQVLEYANESERNVMRQTQLENTRLEAGKGYTTDVLQAKAQLAGAQARRVTAQGQLLNAQHRYRAVFGDASALQPATETIAAPSRGMPADLDTALNAVDTQNIDLLAARERAQLQAADRDAIRSREFMPRIDLVVEKSKKSEYDGFIGDREDLKAMVQATWSFDFGMRQSRAVDAAASAFRSEQEKARYVSVQVLEETRNAWADYTTAREREAFLAEQVDLAQRFVDLARKERELGRRSLLDVLNGETNLINARSDAAAARTDVVLASFRIMRALGTLALDEVHADSLAAVAHPAAAEQIAQR